MRALDNDTIRSAFAAAGRRLKLDHDVEILIVGGAAGVLAGLLPATWTTSDVDAMHCHLPTDRDAVLDAAAEVGKDLSLPADWLNDWGGLFFWTLPEDWKSRRIFVGQFGRLHVYAAGRQDLIAMKFIAHRERDLEHLEFLHVTAADVQDVRSYLDRLASAHPEQASRIDMARVYADNWEPRQ